MGPVREQVALSELTTLRVGGAARRFVEAETEEEVVAGVRAADERGDPLLVLGGGSNLLVCDEGFPGTVVRVATRGVRLAPGRSGGAAAPDGGRARGPGGGPATDGAVGRPVEARIAAGEEWDSVVARCVAEGLAGLECLSGVPGRAGATPIQNVGAYGQEVAETITSVRAYDRRLGRVADLPAAACEFGYRTSAFKRDLAAAGGDGRAPGQVTGRFVVLSVVFQLAAGSLSAPVRYAELASALGVGVGGRAPVADVRAAVVRLRRRKGMVLDDGDVDSRSAGSFFTNPVLGPGQFAALRRAARAVAGPGGDLPHWPADGGHVKVSAAWLIEHAGFPKGWPAVAGRPRSGARISTKHTLALVNPGGASASDVAALAREVRRGVRAAFGVDLAPEPVLVGLSL